jgi:hypothetical protein
MPAPQVAQGPPGTLARGRLGKAELRYLGNGMCRQELRLGRQSLCPKCAPWCLLGRVVVSNFDPSVISFVSRIRREQELETTLSQVSGFMT